ncbi:MAG: TetR/AcrR family transcriptional regulator [Bacteroidales bacterium]
MVKKKRIRRSKNFINNEIMKAVSSVIGEQGFANLGINSVAIEAKVEKPFIYRNFGTFDKVLEQYILKNDYWMKFIIERAMDGKVDENGNVDVPSLYPSLMAELYKSVDESRDFRNIILWEIYEDSSFIRKVANRREKETHNEIELLEKHFAKSNVDISAITALLISGVYYTVLHKEISTFCGIDFKTKEGKKRMHESLKLISTMLFEKASEQNKVVVNMLKKGLDANLIAEVTETSVDYVKSVAKSL